MPATSTVTTARFVQATALLGQASSSRGSNPGLETAPTSILTPESGLTWLNAPAALWELVPNLVGGLTAWIISHIGPIDEALDQLTGDPGALRQTADSWTAVGTAFDTHASAMNSVGSTLAQSWSGEAATEFSTHNAAEQGCARASVGVFSTMGTRLVGVGSYVGNARKAIISIAGKLIGDLVRAAIKVAGYWWKPWAWASAISDFVSWALDFIGNTLRRIATILQDVVAQGTMLLGQVGGMGEDLGRAAQILRTGTDPGGMDDVAAGSIADRERGGSRQSDLDLARILASDSPETMPPGYAELTDDEVRALGIDPALLVNDETGFKARVVQGPDGKLVIDFAGTDFSTKEDVAEDGTGAVVLSGQSADASRLAEAINRSSRADDVVYAGHSLGGRLATVASMTSGNPAVTFNAAGVSPATVDYFAQRNGVDPTAYRHQLNNGQVRLYTTADDPLTNLQENWNLTSRTAPDAIGQQYRLGGNQTSPVDGHLMPNVVAQLERGVPVGAGDTSISHD